MPRFMIEVEHEPATNACDRAVQMFLATGSHYLTHADWGCLDGEHTAWLAVEVATREEARAIVPPLLRARARIVALNRFGSADLELLRDLHRGGAAPRPSAVASDAR